MNEKEPVIFKPIRQNSPIEADSPPVVLTRKYRDMAQVSPPEVVNYKNVINAILASFSDDKGELVFDKGGNRIYFSHQGKWFTNFGVIPLEIIVEHSVDKVEHYLELLVLKSGTSAQIIKLRSAELGSSRWIERLGPSFIYEKAGVGRIQTLVKAMSQYAPARDEYLYTGWNVEDGKTYILDGHPLCAGCWDVAMANQNCGHALSMLDTATHSLTIPLLSVGLLSLVHSHMVAGGTYFKGVCCVVAPTQSFKTTLAALFLNLNNGLEADLNFEATTAAIVRTIGGVRDVTVILDDYKPGATKAESNDMLQKLSKVVRMCSDNSGGIKRAGAQNLTISNVANCLTVVTAEQIQLNVQSTLARLLILEGNRESVDKGRLTYFQRERAKYKKFIADYILYITKQGVDKYCEKLVHRFLTERDVLRNKMTDNDVFVDNRTNDMCVWIYISFSEFMNYALYVRAVNQDQFEQYMQEAIQIFCSLMERQAERVSDLDDTKKFFKGLQVLLETKEARIEILQPRNNNYITTDSRTAIGFTKKGFVYLKNGVVFQQVVAYYHKFGKEFAVSEAALRKVLGDNGYILPKNEKTYIHRLSINHEVYQCIQFQENKFYELLNGGKNNGSERDREVPGNRGMYKNADNFLGR